MTTHFPIIYSEEFLQHETGKYHPERSGRLTAIVTALHNSDVADRLQWLAPTPVVESQVLQSVSQVHTPEYIAAVKQMSERGGGYIDNDTVVSKRSYEVALLAVNAWLDGVDQVLQREKPVFVAARPPGHHARSHTGMGFCIFSNAAIAAFHALQQPHVNRVAILDWDVHHGNGTQEIVWDRSDIAYISTHQAFFYPGTGWQEETGAHQNVLNLPMRSESTITEYLIVFEQKILPFLQTFQPDLLIVSAGFDANADDPLANMSLKPKDYGTLTNLCLQITPKILFGLEGGYDFDSLSQSVLAVVEACLAI